MDKTIARKRLQLQGLVQGVGLRPVVYKLAQQMGLGGWVSNSPAGAVIEIEGSSAALEAFPQELIKNLPALAQVLDWQEEILAPRGEADFFIRPSLAEETQSSLFCPDLALCGQCRQEFLDKNNRRYRYPFIGCPACGPRFSVISELPYDRVRSSMADFSMCPACQEEYNNPAERRFHSQLNCCPHCGPQLQLWHGDVQLDCPQPLEEAIRQLQAGRIVAVKGLGGFHLAVDAANHQAVARLRRRKGRPHKPLAVMAADLAKIEGFCRLSPQARALLQSPAAPIVLLPKRCPQPLAENLAPGNHSLGVMLPYTPLHYLLSEPLPALVLTSGNLSDEPLVTDNQAAREQLGGIADYILLHDRSIQQPCDDSVVNSFSSQTVFLRRSRGYTPQPFDIGRALPPILACGGELKNTFALSCGQQVFLSQHLGDLKSVRAYQAYRQAIAHYQRLLRVEPDLIAHDLHPDYLSTRYAKDCGLPTCGVQHHHAHIASVMGEYGLEGPVIGVAWDGSGYGTDGRLWGGEFLIADYGGYRRRAHFAYLPLPGGEAAVYQPWRTALSLLYRSYNVGAGLVPCSEPGAGPALRQGKVEELALSLWSDLSPEQITGVLQMLARDFNCPQSSSCGRLFDGVAAILGLCSDISYEGQAAIALQTAAQRVQDSQCYPYQLQERDRLIIDPADLVTACLDERHKGVGIDIIARRFHNTLAAILLKICRLLRRESGLKRVVLAGGVFQNELLLKLALPKLIEDGFEVYLPQHFPPNDGGLSLGQLLVAQAVNGGN